MRHPDVLVLGVGRSGTSFTAGILHNYFKVCMGHKFISVKQKIDHRDCSYECDTMSDPSRKLCGYFGDNVAKRQLKDRDFFPADWLTVFNELHYKCTGLCGTKITHLSWITPEDLKELNPKLVVRTWRDEESTITSMAKIRRKGIEYWRPIYREGEANLHLLETTLYDVPFVRVAFPKGRILTKQDVITILEPYMINLLQTTIESAYKRVKELKGDLRKLSQEDKIDWVYGNLKFENPSITKESVAEAIKKKVGDIRLKSNKS